MAADTTPAAAPVPRWDALERVITRFAPSWALQREAARSRLQLAAAYDAATVNRRTLNWNAPATSANAETWGQAATIRNRANDLVRNNPHALTATRKLAAKIIGTGIVPRLSAADDEIERKQRATDDWKFFVDSADPEGQLDWYGLTKLAARAWAQGGEVLLRYYYRPNNWKLKIPLQVQVLEADYLDLTKTALANDGSGNVVIQGVEYDPFGRRVAYWLYPEHPGEPLWGGRRSKLISERVPASQIRHMFEPLRPGQARGVSMFASVALRLKDMDDYDASEAMRKKIAACFSAIVTRAGGAAGAPMAGSNSTQTTTDDKGRRLENIQPGRFQYLDLNESVNFPTPPEAGGYVDYMTYQLMAVAAGVGITYEALTGDLKGRNFSSIRAGNVDFFDQLDQWQWLMVIPQICAPTWARVGAISAAVGRRDPNAPYLANWATPRRRWIDPAVEVAATRDAVRAGLMSQTAAIAEQGEDPDDVLAEIARDNAKLDQLGIVLDTDPRKVSRGGGQTTAGDGLPGEPGPGQQQKG
jgi:lambda family phage portal protein